VWNSIVDFIKGIPQRILDGLAWLANLGSRVGDWFRSVYDAGRAKLWDLVDFVRGIPGRILDALGNMGSLLWNAGRSIIDGFLRGLQSAYESVKNFVKGIAGWIADHKGPLSYDYTLLQPAAGKIMGGFHDQLAKGMKDVQGLVSGFARSLSTSLDVNAALGTPTSTGAPAESGVTVSVNVDTMNVRSDQDIRDISTGIADLVSSRERSQGRGSL